MPLPINSIVPANIKAKNVATESYVDDISDDLSNTLTGKLPQVFTQTDAPTSSNIAPVGSTWRQEKTVNGNTEYLHWISEGNGVWREAGGTYIDGSKIVTGTIDAAMIGTGSLKTTALSTATVDSNYSGTIVDSKGVRVYSNGQIRVQMGDLG
jgi:hypothetical protein